MPERSRVRSSDLSQLGFTETDLFALGKEEGMKHLYSWHSCMNDSVAPPHMRKGLPLSLGITLRIPGSGITTIPGHHQFHASIPNDERLSFNMEGETISTGVWFITPGHTFYMRKDSIVVLHTSLTSTKSGKKCQAVFSQCS